MRVRRIKLDGAGVYHCMSRTVNGAALFKMREKEVLRGLIHRIADFSGVEVLTYCIMNNHFHVLVRVPDADPISDQELMRRYRVLYPKPTPYQTADARILEESLRKNEEDAVEIRERLLARMHDVSAFMKTLKQRFSTWFNKTHDRYGPLWSDRFKSVLVEGEGYALQTVAAYIDLNPVRANLVKDPKDYRFCGYAEAVAKQPKAILGLKFVTCGLYRVDDSEALRNYRQLLYGKGAAPAEQKMSIDHAEADRVLKQEAGGLSQAELLRCRVRYFSEGVVLGSAEFVRRHAPHWQRVSQRSKPAHPVAISGFDPNVLSVMRNVRGQAFFLIK